MAEQKTETITRVDSDYRLVLLVALRSKQIQHGSPHKAPSRFTKPTRIALDEVRKNLVEYILIPPKEAHTEK